MFNEMGHQPTFTRISHFKKSSLPCIWIFFGIVLHCLTGRTSGLDKAKLEVYTIVAGLYYSECGLCNTSLGGSLELQLHAPILIMVFWVLFFRA